MYILISLTYYLPYISGLSIYAQRLAEGLRKKGYEIEILTSQYSRSLSKKEFKEGVLITRIPYLFKFSKALFMPRWPWNCFQKIKKADVVICNFPQPEALWLIILAKVLKKKSIIVYQCDVQLPPGLLNRILEKIIFFFNILSCFFAEIVVNSSKDYAKNSPVLSLFLNKVVIIYPPVKGYNNLQIKTSEKNFLTKKLFQSSNRIGYVGRIAADKGVEYLFEAIPYFKKQLDNFKIYLVGPKKAVGEEDYIKKIELLKRKYKDYVFYLGSLTDEELVLFYKNVDVLVLPSVNSTEAFGMVQVEAMFCGLPVVATNLPGVRTPIKLTRMGKIVPIRDSKKIAKAVIKILRNKRKYLKPKKEIGKIFSFKKSINSYERLLF